MKLGEARDFFRAVRPVLKNALTSGQIFRPQCVLTEPDPDILCEFDVEIPLTDGTFVTANIFRSRRAQEAGEKWPVVMCAHPYDNRLVPSLGKTPLGGPPLQYRMIPQEGRPEFSSLTSWESPDPNFWVRSGYAVVNMNLPGFANSGGRPGLSTANQADAFAQAIDWIGTREWCTGSVGLSGVSYLAISQYGVAAGQGEYGVPKCLKAISPWEGVRDLYREMFFEGGIQELGFPVFWWHTEVKPTINCSEEEFIEIEGQLPQYMGAIHPFYDEYWQSKVPPVADIELPMLICASFSDQGLHTRGSFGIFREARSRQKWVYTHRRLKWDAYYSPEVQAITKLFFDHFVKGEEGNDFLEQPPVRLEVRASRDEIHEVRGESEWPLARTRYEKWFLAEDLSLESTAVVDAGEAVYDARSGELRFRRVFGRDTELTGYMKLRLWVEARSDSASAPAPDDMALFIGVDKRNAEGQRVRFYGSVGNHADLVTRGLIAASRRALDPSASTEFEPVLAHQRDEKLAPGDIVALEIALNPSSTFFRAGEALELIISPREIVPSPPYRKSTEHNRGLHVIHFGGDYDSHLLVPEIPGRAD
ncbi:MAG: CocE/NonD family hydrolase [Myxococcota bacterium]|jgi:uncharacterized protein|nr:CocE/NonD family hydrolase [Myxococcota bacterium]